MFIQHALACLYSLPFGVVVRVLNAHMVDPGFESWLGHGRFAPLCRPC